ncbi:hypothetical protein [Halobacteriovorax sp. HLS]|uniref:hypothetical protein n=1 Tax=Halobacteriovorax sp. HLS TaxID=2234000 RepID=UPI000FDB20AD|nr:hypothetical protein [Halobacteriovorax sp. HLS]
MYLSILLFRLRGLKALFTNDIKEKLKNERGATEKLEKLIQLNITDNKKNIFYIKKLYRLRLLVYCWIIAMFISLVLLEGF